MHACADVAKSLGAQVEPDSCALAALAARRALHLVAACMHVPAVHASMLEQNGLLQPPSTAQVVMVHHPCILHKTLAVLVGLSFISCIRRDLSLYTVSMPYGEIRGNPLELRGL